MAVPELTLAPAAERDLNPWPGSTYSSSLTRTSCGPEVEQPCVPHLAPTARTAFDAMRRHQDEFARPRSGNDALLAIAIHCVVGETHDAAMERARAIYALGPRDQNFDDWFASFTEYRLVGSVDEVAATLLLYAGAVSDRLMILQILHTDLDSIRLIGERLAPIAC